MLKLWAFSHNHHPGSVKMLAKKYQTWNFGYNNFISLGKVWNVVNSLPKTFARRALPYFVNYLDFTSDVYCY